MFRLYRNFKKIKKWWTNKLRSNKMAPLSSFTDTNVEIYTTVTSIRVLYDYEKWKLPLEGEENLLIKRKCE